MHTEAFRHRRFFRELHREAFTQRIFSHRSFYTEKLFHRSFYTEKLLSTSFNTDVFTHRSLYTQEAFTHRSFYTEKPLHTDAFPQKNRFHSQSSSHTLQKIAILRKFLTFGHHIVRKGCIRRRKTAIFDVGQSFYVKGLRLTL